MLELGALACSVVSTASDVPLVDDVLMLRVGDPDGGRVETRRSVWRACGRRGRGAWELRGGGGLSVRSAACSMARNLAVAALRLAVGAGVPLVRVRPGCPGAVVPAPEASWTTSAVTTPALTMQAITQTRSPVQPATVSTPPRAGLARRVSPYRILGTGSRAVVGRGCCVLLGLERVNDLLGGRSVASGQPESVAAVAFLARLQLGERRAVDREVVSEAERERGEVLLRARRLWAGRASSGRPGAAGGVCERPRRTTSRRGAARPVGLFLRGCLPPPPSQLELYHHHLALDCSGNG